MFCNPPYGREIWKWTKKAYEESQKPETLVVLLVHARTDTRWFHDWVYGKAEIRFVKGRLKFGGSKNSAPFPSMIAVFRGEKGGMKTMTQEQFEQVTEEICDKYCKYPDQWDEEKDGDLSESDICRDCPLSRL